MLRTIELYEADQVSGGDFDPSQSFIPPDWRYTGNGCFSSDDGQAFCQLSNSDFFTSNGELYSSQDGMVFRSYEACIQFYAEKYQEQDLDRLNLIVPITEIVKFFNPDPSTQNYLDATKQCS